MESETLNKMCEAVLTARQMKQYDANTIDRLGIPAPVLMERAALAVADAVCAYAERTEKQGEVKVGKGYAVLVAAGCGNNGGDGFAAARILWERGFSVDCILIGEETRCSEQTKQQMNILRCLGMDILRNFQDKEYDIIIDALFGIGLTREVQGEYKEAIQRINTARGFKISVDIPSGVETDSGKVLGCAVRANQTVTFGYLKRGLCLYPGKLCAGEVICAGIGITEKSFFGEKPDTFTCRHKRKSLMPERDPRGNKGTFGKLLLIAGSYDMAGAAILCARAAYRMGTGMVKIVTCEENRNIIQQTLPEAMLLTYSEDSTRQAAWMEKWNDSLKWADVYIMGCGCGQSRPIVRLLEEVLKIEGKPMVLDADALNLMGTHSFLLEKITRQEAGIDGLKILTPHPGELSRVLGIPVEEVTENLTGAAERAAKRCQSVVAAKDAVTAVVSPEGQTYLNASGNSGMATAGSGDVLAGVIGGLLSQKERAYDAAWKGVYLHGLAGDLAAAEKGEHAVVASDIIEALPEVIK